MYSTYNERKSVAERFIKTLISKIYKRMAAVSKNVDFDVLDDIFDKYNNAYHKFIKMKPVDVKSMLNMLNTMLILLQKILNLK